MTFKLPKTVARWDEADLTSTFATEVLSLPRAALSLDRAMSRGNALSDDEINIMIIARSRNDEYLRVHAGIFFRSVIAGCNCADDPSPMDTIEEYTELEFHIDPGNASVIIEPPV